MLPGIQADPAELLGVGLLGECRCGVGGLFGGFLGVGRVYIEEGFV